MEDVIWTLTDEEKTEIQQLFEKKIALENLSKIIDPENDKLYSKLIFDYGSTVHQFNNWWSKMSQKYQWEGQNWSINFETNDVLKQQ